MQIKKQQLELNMELLTGSELRKEYVKDVYLHPAYLTYMQRNEKLIFMRNAGLEGAQAGIKIAREISITLDMQMTLPLWQKVKRS